MQAVGPSGSSSFGIGPPPARAILRPGLFFSLGRSPGLPLTRALLQPLQPAPCFSPGSPSARAAARVLGPCSGPGPPSARALVRALVRPSPQPGPSFSRGPAGPSPSPARALLRLSTPPLLQPGPRPGSSSGPGHFWLGQRGGRGGRFLGPHQDGAGARACARIKAMTRIAGGVFGRCRPMEAFRCRARQRILHAHVCARRGHGACMERETAKMSPRQQQPTDETSLMASSSPLISMHSDR